MLTYCLIFKVLKWCPEAESNHRHGDFQSPALPTELSGHLAERVGFEPTVPLSITGFQDQLLKPLGHLSTYFAIFRSLLPIYRLQSLFGWGCRTRTYACMSQSHVPYRLG